MALIPSLSSTFQSVKDTQAPPHLFLIISYYRNNISSFYTIKKDKWAKVEKITFLWRLCISILNTLVYILSHRCMSSYIWQMMSYCTNWRTCFSIQVFLFFHFSTFSTYLLYIPSSDFPNCSQHNPVILKLSSFPAVNTYQLKPLYPWFSVQRWGLSQGDLREAETEVSSETLNRRTEV